MDQIYGAWLYQFSIHPGQISNLSVAANPTRSSDIHRFWPDIQTNPSDKFHMQETGIELHVPEEVGMDECEEQELAIRNIELLNN